MKQFWTAALISIAGLVLVSPGTLAQEDSGLCFMTTSSGQRIDLGSLCGEGELDTQKPSQQSGVFSAPIVRRASGIPIIQVTFNSTKPFDMMVDTGASGTLITQQMAKILGVKQDGFIQINTASARGVKIPTGVVNSIEVDGAVVQNVKVAIAGPELDVGLLGHDFFGQYDVTIKENIVEFRRRS